MIVRHCEVMERHFDHLGEGLLHVTGANLDLYLDMINDPSASEAALSGYEPLMQAAERSIAELAPWPKVDPIS